MIFQHTCPICGTHLDAEEEIAALRARIEALTATNDVAPPPTPCEVIPMPVRLKTRRGGMKINGVRITPRWEWMPDYLAHVREVLRDAPEPRSKADKDARLIERAAAYARWIAERDGRTDVPKHCLWIEIDDSDVVFYQTLGGRFGTEPKRGAEITRVTIPNMHWEDPYMAQNVYYLMSAE